MAKSVKMSDSREKAGIKFFEYAHDTTMRNLDPSHAVNYLDEDLLNEIGDTEPATSDEDTDALLPCQGKI